MRIGAAWRVGLATLTLGAALIIVPSAEHPVLACSCGLTTVEQAVGSADAVFDMAVTDVVWEDDFNATVYGEVVRVYKGETQQFVSSALHYGTSCAGPPLFSIGEVVIGTLRSGRVDVSHQCGPGLHEAALASVFEPIIQPEPRDGTPLVVASIDRPGARVAVLDDELRVSHYGPGDGHVKLFAACPDGAAIVELVTDDFGHGEMTVETRDLASLEVTAVVDIDRQTHTSGAIVDLECHDAGGSVFSYLVQRLPREKARQRNPEKAESVIEIWRSSELQELVAREASAATVDLNTGVAHVLAPEDGSRVERWNVASAEREAEFDLVGVSGVDIARNEATGAVFVLGAQSDRRPKKHGLGILVEVGTDDAEAKKIKDAARPHQLVLGEGVIYTVVKIPNVGMVLQARQPSGKILEQHRLGFVQRHISVVPVNGQLVYEQPNNGIRLVDPGGEASVAALDGADVLVGVLGPSVEIDAADIPARFELGGTILSGGVTPPERPGPFQDGPRLFLLFGAAVLVLALGIAAVRRRRIPVNDGWMQATRDEGPEGPS